MRWIAANSHNTILTLNQILIHTLHKIYQYSCKYKIKSCPKGLYTTPKWWVTGHWQPVQCTQGGPSVAAWPSCSQAWPVPGVRCGHVDIAAVLLYAGSSLASLHLVFHWTLRCRQWSAVFLAVEIGKCHTGSIFLCVDKWYWCCWAGEWTIPEDYVCDCPVFHYDLHDKCWVWECCCWNWQWEDFHHLHDDYSRLEYNLCTYTYNY